MASRIVSIPARFAPVAAPVTGESLRPTRYAGPRTPALCPENEFFVIIASTGSRGPIGAHAANGDPAAFIDLYDALQEHVRDDAEGDTSPVSVLAAASALRVSPARIVTRQIEHE